MRVPRLPAVVLFASVFIGTASAADALKLGGAAPDWKGLKGTDGKEYSLSDFDSKEVLVIVFTCNSCGYAQDYEDRIIQLARSHCTKDHKAALVAINPNKVKEDLPEEMQKRVKAKG